jgi:hypothetical protein
MKTLNTILATAALVGAGVAVAALSSPVDTAAFNLLGGSLGQAQRDFRVDNNFSDPSANNNTTPHVNFPGALGAVMAIWKGHVEWSSEPYAGNGLGDGVSSNPVLGSGGANFDNIFQGTATAPGGANGNVHSELAGSSGSTLAFTLSPISDGWQIQYLSSWTWQDGPGSVSGGIDLQGVACHEIGHSLGLDHSNVPGATMQPAISGSGVSERSIESDDILGVQAIYGVKSASKPHIGSLSGSTQIGQTLTINGSNFTVGNTNEVWFTKLASDGMPVKVLNVNSVSGNSVSVTIPANVQDGEVMVKNNGTGFANLSNAFPIDISAGTGDPPVVTSINPTTGPAGGFTQVALTGSGFTGANSVTFGGVEAESFTVNSNTSITAVTPPGQFLTQVDVTVTDSDGAGTLAQAYIYLFNPAIDVSTVKPDSGLTTGGTPVVLSGASALGITSVEFDGVPATDVEVISATEVAATTPPHAAGTVDVTVNGGVDTIPGGFTYVNDGAFIDIGPGLAGSLGVPLLSGSGDLTPGSPTGFTLDLSSANPSSLAVMFVSLSQAAAPFKGGTLYTLPILLQLNLATDGFGQLSLPAQIAVGTPPGTSFVLQFWIADAAAIHGASASNGLKVVTP